MAHTAPYDEEKEKKDGPRHIDVSWAVCKFFSSFYFNLLTPFSTRRLREMTHTAPYDGEKAKKKKKKKGPRHVDNVSWAVIGNDTANRTQTDMMHTAPID